MEALSPITNTEKQTATRIQQSRMLNGIRPHSNSWCRLCVCHSGDWLSQPFSLLCYFPTFCYSPPFYLFQVCWAFFFFFLSQNLTHISTASTSALFFYSGIGLSFQGKALSLFQSRLPQPGLSGAWLTASDGWRSSGPTRERTIKGPWLLTSDLLFYFFGRIQPCL